MNLDSTAKMTQKDIDKLNKQYAKGKIYIHGIVKEQEKISKAAENNLKEVNKRLKQLQKELKPYASGTNPDDKFYEYKEEYSTLLSKRNSLEQTILICSESITSAQLHHLGE